MNLLQLIWDKLRGRKTYIAAGALLLHGALLGDWTEIWQALAIFGLRQAI